MATQKYMGRGQLVDRLSAQVGSKAAAISILKRRGQMDAKGNLTAFGKARNNMTAKERAVDRAKKAGAKGPLKYNPKTNRVTKK